MRRTERNHGVRRLKRAVAAALVPLALLSLSTTLRANRTRRRCSSRRIRRRRRDGARFRAFKLNQVGADSPKQLTQFFAATPGIEIVADAPRNRVLVRGDPQILEQAGELLAKLDPPAAECSAGRAAETSAATTRSLPADAGVANHFGGTRKASGGPAGHSRRGRRAVVAGAGARAESIHSQIREKLAQAARVEGRRVERRNCRRLRPPSVARSAAASDAFGRRFAGAARAALVATAAGEHRLERPMAEFRNRSGAGRGSDRDGQSDDGRTASLGSAEADRRLAAGDRRAR